MNEYTFVVPCKLTLSYLADSEEEASEKAKRLVESFEAYQNRNGFDIDGENHWLEIGELPQPGVWEGE